MWRRRFGKLEPADVKCLRELEAENATLKRILAERDAPAMAAMRRIDFR